MITNTKGDLLEMFSEGKFDVIVHGANCFHLMGSGIAGQISSKFPEAFSADKQTLYGDIDKLGKYSYSFIKNCGIIVNGYTQYRPGKEHQPRLYASICELFDHLANDLENGTKIGIPKIGSGIAGGDWSVIEEIIRVRMIDMKVTVVEYSEKVLDTVDLFEYNSLIN